MKFFAESVQRILGIELAREVFLGREVHVH
jgi:hypothetical protein